jgi:hypothetical protein
MLGIAPVGSVKAQNKYAAVAGGAPSNAVIEANTTNPLTALGTPFYQSVIGAFATKQVKFAEPLIIPPGMGIVAVNMAWAKVVGCNFEFREDPVGM